MLQIEGRKMVLEGPVVDTDKAYPEYCLPDKCCHIPIFEVEFRREKLPADSIAEYKAELEAEGKPLHDGWDEVRDAAGVSIGEYDFKVGKRYRITVEELD